MPPSPNLSSDAAPAYRQWDVIVVGGGHAGCEAALAATRLGARVMLLTMNLDHVAQMSCNPAIGGIAKGQLVREIDALGGEMGRNTDLTTLQFRMLNRSKGPAVWSPRAQCDKLLYQRRMKHVLEQQQGLFMHQAEAVRLNTAGGRITGVETQFGESFDAKAVVLATGTFLGGRLHYGGRTYPGGRTGDPAAIALADCLRDELKLRTGRLKTGTPPRVMRHTVDLSRMREQQGEAAGCFSHWHEQLRPVASLVPADLPPRSCYQLKSTAATRDIVLRHIDKAPMYNGSIDAIGTRYCPSFEDKVMRFTGHESHQLYLEPEGAYTEEFYLNGISTGLPVEVQWEMIRSLPGLEQAELSRYAYAIEYEFVFPHQLQSSLAAVAWPNLFLAGQINGTTGYEEAAGQGLVAGVNAARQAADKSPLVLGRDQAYLGVMIDDLVTKEIVEPYRLFTSRAEYRLLLRQDNAWRRLAALGHEIGLLPESCHRHALALDAAISRARDYLETERRGGESLWEHLRRKAVCLDELPELGSLDPVVREQLEIDAHYDGYLRQERARVARLAQLASWRIPPGFEYDMPGLRNEARAKLQRIRPESLAQAARIDGVTPTEISLLQVHLKRRSGTAPPA